MKLVVGFSIIVIRSIPYPPSFNKMAASTIEPAIGASTCALGSHKWRPYRGIFTINASMYANHKAESPHIWLEGWVQYWISNRFRDPVEVWV